MRQTNRRQGLLRPLWGKMLAYLLLEAVILPLYLIALPYLYGLPRLGGVIPILVFAVPFVLSISGLGLVVAAIFKNPLSVQLVPGSDRTAVFLSCRVCLADRSDPTRCSCGLVAGAKYLRD